MFLSLSDLSIKRKFAELSLGLTVSNLITYSFEYFLYPFSIYKLGILKGGLVMTFLSFIICILAMKFYDWSKRDWIGIEAIKEIKTYKGTKKIWRVTSWVLKKSEPIVFLFLSVKFDPFVTTAYMRHGSHQYNGMNKRDWTIFMSSLIVSNGVWIFACFTGISMAEWVLNQSGEKSDLIIHAILGRLLIKE